MPSPAEVSVPAADAAGSGSQHVQLGELLGQRDRRRHGRLRVIGHHDHRVLGQERLDAAGGVHHARELNVGQRDRAHLSLRTRAVGVPIVVGQRQQQEVEQVVLDHVGADAAGVAVAHPWHAERRAAAGAAAGEDVRVEQLARAHHRVAHQSRGDPRERAVALGLVAVAAAVHQVGGAGGAHVLRRRALSNTVGVPLRQVRAVHVVDGVGQLACETDTLGGTEAGAVLDVAPLGAVIPAHARYVVAVLPGARNDRGRATGVTEGNAATQSGT